MALGWFRWHIGLGLSDHQHVIADGHADPNGSVIQCQNTRAHG